MRVLIAGGGDIGRITAESLVNVGHEVIVIDESPEVCERLASELDLMCICGDATRPHLLEKAEIEKADIVIALSGTDQENLITALIAKEYGVKRVIVKLDDPDFNIVCYKLGIEEVINPKVATAKHVADMTRKLHALELSTLVGGSIRVFTAIIKKDNAGKRIDDLGLPGDCLPAVIQREEEFFIAKSDIKVMEGDRLDILCEEATLEALAKSFS
jgi:trk system potassium uptake protein TrkA